MRTLSTLLAATAVVAATSAAALPAEGHDRTGSASAAQCHGHAATVVGTSRPERLVGTPGPDVIAGGGGADTILGLGGDDVLCGNLGADILRGGAGDDELFGGYGGVAQLHSDRGGVHLTPNRLVGGAGDDLLDGGFGPRHVDEPFYAVAGIIDYSSAAQGVQVDLTNGTALGAGTDKIVLLDRLEVYGSPYDDVLVGDRRDDKLIGADGDDTITGGRGRDVLEPDSFEADRRPGDDIVDGGRGRDEIISWVGADDLRGGVGDDTVQAYSIEPAQVRGGPGEDALTLAMTADPGYLVDGGPGIDTLGLTQPSGDSGPDDPATYTLRIAEGTLSRGDEVMGSVLGIEGPIHLGGRFHWVYYGTGAADLVGFHFARGVRAWTYGGDDVVHGSPRADRIHAGTGHDEVDGAGGRDVCTAAEMRRRCEVVRP